tara:strand:+ start:4398 stop:4553 length:156 start_codon:yes stop_codon:yes gene_type:complete
MCLILFVAAFTVFVILFMQRAAGLYFTRRLSSQINPDFGRNWAGLGKIKEL